jgi:hypothetical protein
MTGISTGAGCGYKPESEPVPERFDGRMETASKLVCPKGPVAGKTKEETADIRATAVRTRVHSNGLLIFSY